MDVVLVEVGVELLEVADVGGVHVDPAPAASWRATCYGRMGLAADAAALWDGLLARVPPSSRRDYGVYRARQATALAVGGEPEQAVRVAAGVVALAAETGSARMRAELLTLRQGMAPWRYEAPGIELDDLLGGGTRQDSG